MSNWKTYRALGTLVLLLGTSRLDAGSMTPYQTVMLDNLREPDRDQLLIVDMETGTYTEVPIPHPERADQPVLGVNSVGPVYVFYGTSRRTGSAMMRLDPTLPEWTTTQFKGNVEFPHDLEFMPDGTLITAGEFRLAVINLATQNSGPPELHLGNTSGILESGPSQIKVDASGAIALDYLGQGGSPLNIVDIDILFRQAPGPTVAERLDVELPLTDIAFDLDGSLIGVVTRDRRWNRLSIGAIYGLDFDRKSVDLLFESELLKGTQRIEIDPAGRIVALTQASDTLQRLVRIDLEPGTTEVIAEFEGRNLEDMDLRIIPEPSACLLLLLGIVGSATAPRRVNTGQRQSAVA